MMSYAGQILKDMTPVEQARWWLHQAVAHQFGEIARDYRGIYPALPYDMKDVVDKIEELIDAKIKAALATPEKK